MKSRGDRREYGGGKADMGNTGSLRDGSAGESRGLHEFGKILKLSTPALMMVVGGGWFGDSLYDALLGQAAWQEMIVFGGVGALVFLLGAFWLYKQRKEYLPLRTLGRVRDIRPRKVLISTISPKNNKFELDLPADWDAPMSVRASDGTVSLSGELEKDGEPCAVRWNWQQVLRAIAPHRDILERVHLIGSSGEGGSQGELEECRRLLERYLPENCVVTSSSTGVDFEDIDALTRRFRILLAELKTEGFGAGDVMIDTTGGMKTTSIAAAMVTQDDPGLHFQYVPTQGDDFRPFAFNVVAETQPNVE